MAFLEKRLEREILNDWYHEKKLAQGTARPSATAPPTAAVLQSIQTLFIHAREPAVRPNAEKRMC